MVKVKVTFAAMAKALSAPDINTLRTRGEVNLLFSGAKSRYLGGGWWQILGYAQNGKDVERVLCSLKYDGVYSQVPTIDLHDIGYDLFCEFEFAKSHTFWRLDEVAQLCRQLTQVTMEYQEREDRI